MVKCFKVGGCWSVLWHCTVGKHQHFKSGAAAKRSQWGEHSNGVVLENLGTLKTFMQLCSCILDRLQRLNGSQRQICQQQVAVVQYQNDKGLNKNKACGLKTGPCVANNKHSPNSITSIHNSK